jgi:hypothetical protein
MSQPDDLKPIGLALSRHPKTNEASHYFMAEASPLRSLDRGNAGSKMLGVVEDKGGNTRRILY